MQQSDVFKIRRPTFAEAPFVNGILCREDGFSIGEISPGYPTREPVEVFAQIADRVVACFAACEGIPDPAAFLARAQAIEEALRMAVSRYESLPPSRSVAERMHRQAEFDAMLKALALPGGAS